MEHRFFLPNREAHHPFQDGELFTRMGGSRAIDALIDGLYERLENDPALRPLFGRDLTNEREAQKRFFTEWLGGASVYTDRAFLPMKHRHDLLPITRALASRWIAHFRASLEAAVSSVDVRKAIEREVRAFAFGLVNETDRPSALRAHPHGTCLRYEPAIESLSHARRGDLEALSELLDRHADILASAPHAAKLMHLAARGGHATITTLLLDRGVDPNKPSPIEPLIFVTPLCAARTKRRKDVEALLNGRGACEDVFTHAYLGALAPLEKELLREPSAAQAVDPAVDALAITPIHHAVAGEQVEALHALLSRATVGNQPIVAGCRAVREAAARENVAMVALLLEHGADATGVGAGRWVLHPELAPMLSRAGATVDRSGAWIGMSCTGNQGRKDDPGYVAALLGHGARVSDRRLSGQGNDGGRATALHYASKAGFLKTIALLLEAGADPKARDDNGLTPADWLERSAKSVDRAGVRRMLARVESGKPPRA